MSVLVEQDGYPYIPEPDDLKHPTLATNPELRDFFRAYALALRDYFAIQKTDADRVAAPGLAGTKVYYVADSSGGAVTRKLTFVDGILTLET